MSAQRLTKKRKIEGDPILRTFCVNADSRIFDVAGFFAPISIKDQLIRACWILERAVNLKIIEKDKRLLIVGAGPAGIIASIKAKELGFTDITLVEKGKVIGSVLRNARRSVDFVQYDWSAEHWDKTQFPIGGAIEKIPFFVNTDDPQIVANKLRKDFFNNRINKKFSREIKLPKKIRGGIEVEIQKLGIDGRILETTKEKFDMAISCAGFGSELVEDKDSKFRGFTFWEFANHSVYSHNPNQKILVCGSGDGALQDFLLLATIKKIKTAKDFYEGLQIPPKVKSEIEHNIFLAEEAIKRKQIWLNKSDKTYDAESCKLFSELQNFHKKEVHKILRNSKVKHNLKEMLSQILLNGNLELAFSCNHFGNCYPLNRFLMILIDEYLTEKSEKSDKFKKPFIIGCRVNIKSEDSSHRCDILTNDSGENLTKTERAERCSKYKHLATFTHKCKCSCKCRKKTAPSPKVYDKVIVRFGIGEIKPVFGNPPALPGTQILPYSLP